MKIQGYLLPAVLFSLLCFLFGILGNIEYSWENWRPATCTTSNTGCFCELIRNGCIRQPVNAWSSLSFVFIGFLILARAKPDTHRGSGRKFINLITAKPLYSVIYALIIIVIGLGSAFYHASLSFVGQTLDVLGMYLFASFYIVYNLSRIYQFKAYIAAIQFILLNAILSYFLIYHPEFRRYIFVALIVAALILEIVLRRKRKIRINSRYIYAALVIMLFSFILWLLDTFGVICNPESVFQLHAVWHLGGAAAGGLLYLYFRSENSKPGI